MSVPPPVSAVVFTLNEERNLPACLASLRWCDDVVVVDSYSSDRTAEISSEAGARFVQRRFDGFGTQRNWALDQLDLAHDWVLFLDADERVPAKLVTELERRLPHAEDDVAAFRVRRRFHLWGRWLPRSSLYPTWVVRLVRRGRVRYVDRGHAETQEVSGAVEELQSDLIDENLRGIDAWFARQNRYSTQEAQAELEHGPLRPLELRALLSSDPLARRWVARRVGRSLPLRGAWAFAYVYLLRGGILEGRAGFNLALMKAIYQQMIAIKKFDLARRPRPPGAPQ